MHKLLRFAKSPWLLVPLVLAMIYTLLGFSAIPWAIQKYTPEMAAKYLKRQASVGAVQFNPYLLALEINDLQLKEADGRPIAAFKRLFVDFEATSILRGPWTFADFRLEQPVVQVAIDKAGKLNFARIADDVPKSTEPEPPPPPDQAPPQVLLKHIALLQGAVNYADESKAKGIKETLSPLELELEDLSTVPDRSGNYNLAAKLMDGGSLEWHGGFSVNPISSEGDIRVAGVKLATAWKFIRDRVNLSEPEGALGVSSHYRFAKNGDKIDLAASKLGFELTGLKLALPDAKAPLLALEKIALSDGSLDLATRKLEIPSFLIEKGQVAATMDEAGRVDWLGISKAGEAPASNGAPANPPQPPAPNNGNGPKPEAGPPWNITLGSFKLADLGIQYADASRHTPFVATLEKLGFDFKAQAEVGDAAPKVKVEGFGLGTGRISVSTQDKPDALAEIGGLSVAGGMVDLEQKRATVQRIGLKGGGTRIVRAADGSLPLAAMFGPKAGAPSPAPAEAEAKPEAVKNDDVPGFRVSIDDVVLEDLRVGFADQSFAPPLVYDAEDIDLAVHHVTNDGKTPLGFDTKIRIKQGGSLAGSGTLSPTADKADAKILVDKINLQALQAVVARFAHLTLESADVSTDLKVSYQQAASGPAIKATGTASLGNLLLNEDSSNKRFLAWKDLNVNGIDFSLSPDRARVKEVVIREPGAKIAVFEDKTTNVAKIFKDDRAAKPEADKAVAKADPPPKPAVKAGKAAPSKAPKAETKPAGGFPFNIERVRVEKGVIDYSDASLVIPFATRIHDFQGGVTDISSSLKDRTAVKFDGRIDEFGSVKVDGGLKPMQHKDFSDIKVAFRNVAMNSLSPYSATFAGRRIKSGKLDVDIGYKVVNSHLVSKNRVVLRDFTLGEEVESPTAVSLPLDLAVALLTDAEGKIDAELEAEGDVDNPEFGYGKLIWNAFVNLITKAVTAPFRAIGGLFAGGEDGMAGALLFEPGRSGIPPPELEKLHKVAEVLSQKPGVQITAKGGFDPDKDGLALREQRVRNQVATKMGSKLEPGEDSGPLAFTNADTQKALEALLTARNADTAVDQAAAEFEKTNARKPQRLGPLSLVGKASPDSDFYEFLFRRLVDSQPLAPAEIESLGIRRAEAIAKELAVQKGFDPTRAIAGPPQKASATDEGVPTELELGAKS